MSLSYLLAIIALGTLGAAVWALVWAIDAARYDDLEATGNLVFEDEDPGR